LEREVAPMNVSLTDELKRFVQQKVASGAFPSEEAVLIETVLRSNSIEPHRSISSSAPTNDSARSPSLRDSQSSILSTRETR
jgi:Arc/MetJ-type ribon-helix-helix transcriptional regulator